MSAEAERRGRPATARSRCTGRRDYAAHGRAPMLRTMARIGSPSRRASDNRFKSNTPTPSPGRKPHAWASNGAGGSSRGASAPAWRERLVGRQAHAALPGGADHQVAIAGQEQIGGQREGGQGGVFAAVDGRRPAHQVPRLADSRGQGAGAEAARLVDQGGPVAEQGLGELRLDPAGAVRRDAVATQQRAEDLAHIWQPQGHLQLEGEIAAELGPHHHARPRAVERLLIVARVAQGLVGRVHEHELQRIGLLDLLGRDLMGPPVIVEVGDVTAVGHGAAIGLRRTGRWARSARQRSGGAGDLASRPEAKRSQ